MYTSIYARMYSKAQPAFLPLLSLPCPPRVHIYAHYLCSFVHISVNGGAVHFKRKIFSRLLINGLAGSIYARTISDPETL